MLNTRLPKSDTCLNCGYEVKEHNFCPQCGQENIDYRVSFKALVSHYFSRYFNLDTKLIRTLKVLIIKPWRLSQLYLQGKRRDYTVPIRLYFVLSLLFVIGMRFQFLHNQEQKSSGYIFKIKVNPEAAKNPERLESQKLALQFIKQFPNAMLISVPLTALILTGLYYNTKKYLFIDHLILMLHYYSFVFLISLPFLFISYLSSLSVVNVLISSVYLWIFMKEFYQESAFKTTYKFIVFSLLSGVVVMALSIGLVFFIVGKELLLERLNF
ncbi:MAG: DUF3667 domain-containing protein [Bacteroidia bacterium]|nr:DUF3667 domain-containing protein [Bacteroidia bacterium]MDW8301769.1 DUF3667 domain-containing protein [Bacteroidia bacterium]